MGSAWKAVQKCQDTQIKVFGSCKKKALKGKKGPQVGSDLELQNACLEGGIPDPKRKIQRKCARIHIAIHGICGGFSRIALFPGCDTSRDHCIEERVACEVCQALNEIDVLTVDCDLFDNGIADGSCP